MTIVALTAIAYVGIGCFFSMAADFGWKRRYNRPMSNNLWFAGLLLWPLMLSLGRKR